MLRSALMTRTSSSRTLLGEAPSVLKAAVPAILAAAALTIFLPGIVSWTARFRGVAVALAVFIASLGIPFWISAAIELLRAWHGRRLATAGAYTLCRHPIFAVWVWFVLPCLALAFDSWAFIAAAIAIGIGVRPGAIREERDLEKEFADAWRAYRGRTRALAPWPRFAGGRGPRLLKTIAVLAALGAWAGRSWHRSAPRARNAGPSCRATSCCRSGSSATPRP